jgi:hypothetical protein
MAEDLKEKVFYKPNNRESTKETGRFTFLGWVLMNAKPDFLQYGSFQIQSGRQIRFWEDKWLGNYSFQH